MARVLRPVAATASDRGAYFTDEVKRVRPGDRQPDGGGTLAYLPPPEVVRRMREIDPRLSLEWRPLGTNPATELRTGAWRLMLLGQSGARKGMMLWAPEMMDGRFIAYLETHWLPRLHDARRYLQTTEAFSDELADKARRERSKATWSGFDYGELQWHGRRIHAMERGAGESGQQYWQVPDRFRGVAG